MHLTSERIKNHAQIKQKLYFETNPENIMTCLIEQCVFCTFEEHCFMINNDENCSHTKKNIFETNTVDITTCLNQRCSICTFDQSKIKRSLLTLPCPPAGREASGPARPLT